MHKLRRPLPLDELKAHKDGGLGGMHLFKYGRLSVQAVTLEEWEFVLGLEAQEAGEGPGQDAGQAPAKGGGKANGG